MDAVAQAMHVADAQEKRAAGRVTLSSGAVVQISVAFDGVLTADDVIELMVRVPNLVGELNRRYSRPTLVLPGVKE